MPSINAGTILIRTDPELLRRVREQAKKEDRSVSAWIRRALIKALKEVEMELV